MHSMEKFSDRLKRLRNENGLTVKEVADFLAVAQSTYREWENGRQIRGEPYTQLAKIFKVGIEDLITGEPSKAFEQSDLEKLQELCTSTAAQIAKMKRNSN